MKSYEKFYKMLKGIQENPYLYLSSLSLKHLHLFLMGYEVCAMANGVHFGLHSEFYSFVEKKYDVKPTTYHPFNIITFFEPNEEEAFNKFFELLGEFQKNKKDLREEKKMGVLPIEYADLSLVDKYYEILNGWIRKSPKLYLGTPSLKYLETYINGYFTCARVHQISFNPHDGFDDFVQMKYKSEIKRNSFKIINFRVWNDEERAFYRFFELLDEFLGKP